MYKWTYSILLAGSVCWFTPGFAQRKSKITDSLLAVLEVSQEDTAKVNTLNTLARRMELGGNYGEGITYAHKAKELSERLNYPEGMAHAYNNSGNIYYRQGTYHRALEDLFASLQLFEKLADRNWQARLLGNIGNVYAEQGNYS